MADKIEVFIASATEDEALLRELENQLSGMVRQGLITIWHDRKIPGGVEWEKEIRKHLMTAPIVLLLVSPDFIASEKTYKIAEQAMEKTRRGEARVIPILLHESDWEYTVFGKLKPFPSDRRPVASWSRRNAAFLDIVRGIREAIAELSEKSEETTPSRPNPNESTLPRKEMPVPQEPTVQHDKKFDVFLCYNSEDKAAVKKIAQQLKARSVVPWFDEWELRPGLPWLREIEKQIEEIKTAAVFVGQAGIGPWQQMEVEAFLREFVSLGNPVIPVLLKEAPDKPNLPVFLRGMQWVDFHKTEPEPMGQLIWGITGKNPNNGDDSAKSSDQNAAGNGQHTIPSPAFEEKAMPNTTFANGYALLIGANVNLPITTKDATALHDVLVNPSRAAYPKEHVQLLTEEKATRQGILGAFDKLTEQVKSKPKATVIVYFSGHGIEITRNGDSEYFLIPYAYNPSQRAQTAISGAEFSAQIEAIKARKLVVLLDCCHAAGMPVVKAPGETVEKSAIPLPSDVLHKLEQGSGHVIAASSRKDETSWTGDPYSVFTTCLIEALAGKGAKNPDGFARILDVLGYLFAHVPQRAIGPQHPFVNNIRDLDDNFPLCYYAGGSKEIPGDVSMPPPTPEPIAKPINSSFELQRLQRKQKGLQKQYNELSEKIEYLTSEYNRTAHPPTRFELKKQIEDEEAKLREIEGELSQVEQKIASLTS
jgi:hypothetical protein